METTVLNLTTARAIGSEIDPKNVKDSGMTIREYVELSYQYEQNALGIVYDNVDEAIDATVDGYESRHNEA